MISKSFVARQQIDDAAIGEAVLQDVMLHNLVVAVSVYADIRVIRKAELHDAAKDTVSLRVAGNAMDDMIRLRIIYPLTFIDLGISRFWGWQKSKIAYNAAFILNDKTAIPFQISSNNCL